MFSGLSKNIKKILPKRLFYRALVIISCKIKTGIATIKRAL